MEKEKNIIIKANYYLKENIQKGKDGKGKEYDSKNQLIFKGTYLNGNKSGYAKKHLFFGYLFEGENLNRKENGKGKEYDSNGNLRFEGEYLNGQKNGKAKNI